MAVVQESLGEADLTFEPEYIYLPPLGQQSLVAGIVVRPHVQAFADAVRKATRVQSIGTYIGHDPSADLALDLFHAIGDDELADEICWFAIKALNRGQGIDYVISRQRIFNPEILNEWRPMADRGSPTQNHMDHVHISFEPTPSKPIPEPLPKDDEMAKAALGVYDYDGKTWITDGMFTRPTNDPFVYLNAGLAEFVGADGKFTDGQHGELVERADLLHDPDVVPGGVDLTAIADRVAARVADLIAERLVN